MNTQVHQKKIYFILVRATSLKSTLEQIRYDGHELVLLIQSGKLSTLTEKQKAAFSKIHLVSEFIFEELRKEVDATLADRTDYPTLGFLTNDESCLPLAGMLRDQYRTGEASFEKVNRFKDKAVMKRELRKNDPSLTMPKHLVANPFEYMRDPQAYERKVEHLLSYPIFSKPIDSAASNSTKLIRDQKELAAWLMALGERTNFELDEYITGELFHCDSLVSDGKILFKKISKYNKPCADFLLGSPLGSITLPDESTEASLIAEYHDRVLRALAPIPNGALHLEVFKRTSGELVFLEIAARTPGAYAPQTFLKAFGLSLEETHLKLQMGLSDEATCRPTRNDFSAWIWYPIRPGFVIELTPPQLRCEFEIEWKIKVGDHLKNPAELSDFALGIKLWSDDFNSLKKDFDLLTEFNPFHVSNEFQKPATG